MLFGDKDYSIEELDALFNEVDNQETPPEQEQKPASPEEPTDDQDNGSEKVEQTKAFAKRLRESTDKAVNQEREAIAKQMGFESYDAMIKSRENKLYEEKGFDPEQIAPLVDKVYEERRKADPAYQELEEFRKQKVLEYGKKELAEITKLTNGEVTSFDQLPKDVMELWKETGSLKSAYLQLKGEELITKARAEQSKGTTQHLNTPGGSPKQDQTRRSLTEEEKSMYRYFNPGVTDEQLDKMTKPIR